MSPQTYDVAIIGAGHNGLVAAFYLARAGRRVIVLEQQPAIGGACVTQELIPGFRFSTCAGVLWKLHPKVMSDLDLERHGLRYHTLDPDPLCVFPDGSRLALWRDDHHAAAEVGRLNKHDGAQLRRFREFWRRATALTDPFDLREPPTREELVQHAERLGERELLDRLLDEPLADILGRFFDDPRVQAAFANVDDMVDPWRPGSAWTEIYFHSRSPFGSAMVDGGMGSVTRAMAGAAKSAGASIRTEAEVETILVDEHGAHGVRTSNGDELMARAVVSCADPKRTFLQLLPRNAITAATADQASGLATKVAYLKLHCALRQLPDLSPYFSSGETIPLPGQLAIKPSLEHFRSARAAVDAGEPVDQPLAYIHLPTRFDPSLARDGNHCMSVFVRYAPTQLSRGTWVARRQAVGERLLSYLSEHLPSLRDDLLDWRLLTPSDIEERVLLTDGNIHHLDMVPGQLLDQRPLAGSGYRTSIQRLYLCGAGCHPGGEVTGLPGHNAAQRVLADLRDGTAPV